MQPEDLVKMHEHIQRGFPFVLHDASRTNYMTVYPAEKRALRFIAGNDIREGIEIVPDAFNKVMDDFAGEYGFFHSLIPPPSHPAVVTVAIKNDLLGAAKDFSNDN